MNRNAIIRSLILAGAVLSAAATTTVSARTEIVKCVDAEGNVTLTDGECPSNARTAVLVTGAAEPDAAPVIGGMPDIESVAAERYSMPRVARRELPAIKPHALSRPLARDVATLKAARASLMLLDTTAQSMRAQRLAAH